MRTIMFALALSIAGGIVAATIETASAKECKYVNNPRWSKPVMVCK